MRDPIVRDLLTASANKTATAAMYDAALTALRDDVRKARSGGSAATGTAPSAGGGRTASDIALGIGARTGTPTPAGTTYRPTFYTPAEFEAAYGLPGGGARAAGTAAPPAAKSTVPATLPGGATYTPAQRAAYGAQFTAAQKAAYGRSKAQAA